MKADWTINSHYCTSLTYICSGMVRRLRILWLGVKGLMSGWDTIKNFTSPDCSAAKLDRDRAASLTDSVVASTSRRSLLRRWGNIHFSSFKSLFSCSKWFLSLWGRLPLSSVCEYFDFFLGASSPLLESQACLCLLFLECSFSSM